MQYTPKIIEGRYVLLAAQGYECPICKRLMIKKIERYYNQSSFFPMWEEMSQDAQIKRAGIVYIGAANVDDVPICVECERENKADFKCELCGERKPTGKIQETFGWPADFLCSDCYEKTPAKIWNEKCDELNEAHLYDYE